MQGIAWELSRRRWETQSCQYWHSFTSIGSTTNHWFSLIKSYGILFYSVLFLSDVDCSKNTLKHCCIYLLLWSVVWFQWQNEHPRSAGPVRESDGNSAGHSRADRPPGAEEADESPSGSSGQLQCGQCTMPIQSAVIHRHAKICTELGCGVYWLTVTL